MTTHDLLQFLQYFLKNFHLVEEQQQHTNSLGRYYGRHLGIKNSTSGKRQLFTLIHLSTTVHFASSTGVFGSVSSEHHPPIVCSGLFRNVVEPGLCEDVDTSVSNLLFLVSLTSFMHILSCDRKLATIYRVVEG